MGLSESPDLTPEELNAISEAGAGWLTEATLARLVAMARRALTAEAKSEEIKDLLTGGKLYGGAR